MKTIKITLLLLLAACASQPAVTPKAPAVPRTEVRPVSENLHGVEVTDPYRWLEDQDAPETRAWIEKQNAYTDAVLAHRPEVQSFIPRLTALMNTDSVSIPVWRNGRYFFMRRAVGQDQYSIFMRDADGNEQLLIDPAPLSPDHTVSVGIEDVSNDAKVLAYYVRRGGADETEVHFLDAGSRRDLGTPLPAARYYGVSIASGNETIYFTRATNDGPRVFRRALGGGEETKLFGDGYGKEKIIFAGVSDDGRYLLIHVFHGSAPKKTEIYLDDLRDSAGIRTVVNDLDFRSTGEMAGDTIVIQTNWNAPNDRVVVADAASPAKENWKEIVPENPKASIQSTSLAGGRVFVRYLEDVMPRIIGYDISGAKADDVKFDTPGSLADMSGSWHTPVAFFGFSSFHVPPTIYEYDVAHATRTTFAQQSAPVDASQFTVEQVWYTSKDGTRVPMFVMYKKGLVRDGSHPVFLTGYGGFTSSSLPSFSPRAIVWAEQGGVYAVANLRGGGEFGEAWHRAGMLEKKQNTFDDFIAAAEYLVRERYTSPEHLGIAGGSNGGLLVTAVETQRPDLFGAVVCRYPLIDMLRYHQFLVGSFWVPEYGNAENAADFAWIYPYSPYQHVKKGTHYPATLFITGDADTRVAPLHARKMTALMQASQGGNAPILLRYHVSGGHSGGEPLHVQVENIAEELGFLVVNLSRANGAGSPVPPR